MTKDAVIMTPPEKRWPQLLTFLGGCLAGAAAVVTAALVMDDAPETCCTDADDEFADKPEDLDGDVAQMFSE